MKLVNVIPGITEEQNRYELEMTNREAALLRELLSRVEGDPYSSYARVAKSLFDRLTFLLGLPDDIPDEEPYYVTSGTLRASDLPVTYRDELDRIDAVEMEIYWPQSTVPEQIALGERLRAEGLLPETE
jgi:hypothetical protein